MKKMLLLLVLIFPLTRSWSQEKKDDRNYKIPLIGDLAPSFTAESTQGTIIFPDDFGNRWKVLFSHPQDFTPVCSSEILELANLQKEFDKLKTSLIVLSADPLSVHNEWKKALEEVNFKGREPVKIKFPLVDDDKLVVSKLYGMIHPQSNTTKDVRGVFIIDPDNIVRAIYFYPTNIGRNTDEILRTLQALQLSAKDNILTPADWKAGNDVLVPYKPGADDKKAAQLTSDMYNVTWFMTYKKMNK